MPEPAPDTAGDDAAVANERSHRGIRRWVQQAGQRTSSGLRTATPYGILALLTASAVAPVAGATLSTSGEFAAALNQLGGVGSSHLSTVLSDTAARLRSRGGELTTEQWRDLLAESLAQQLAGTGEAAGELRAEVAELLQAVDGVRVAMDAAAEGTHGLRVELAEAMAGLAAGTTQLRGLAVAAAQSLAELQRQLAAQGGEQRQQTTLTRQSLVAITELRQQVLRALPASPPPDADPPDRPAAETSPPGSPAAETGSPYPGLASFQLADARWFSGREQLVAELLARLPEQLSGAGPLPVMGVSGAGKSSLLRAGLLPAVARGGLPVAGSAHWPWLVMTPGPSPLTELAARTARLAGIPAQPALAGLRTDPAGYGALAAQAALAGGVADARLLIVVDQFEELFTLDSDPGERAGFVTALTSAAPALVVFAVRADFYPQCTRLAPVAPLLSDQPFLIGPLRRAELRQAIAEPAHRAGLSVEPGLVELLLADLGADAPGGYDPGALPLLAHALRATWSRRQGRTLTVAGYRATGGIAEALTATAERIYQGLAEPGRAALRRTLLAMVAVAEGDTLVRRKVDRRGLDRELVATLVAERLVTADQEHVAITHEALLTCWPRLAGWLAADRQALRLRQQLTDAARDWAGAGHDPSLLYRGARLATAQEQLADWPEVGEPEREFLAASEEAAQAELRTERRRTRRLHRLTAGLAAALVVAMLAGGAAVVQTGAAREQRAEALSRQFAAESLVAGPSDPRLAMRRALQAWGAGPTSEARGALLSAYSLPYAGQLGQRPGGYRVGVSPDGSQVAVGHLDGEVELWDTGSRQPAGEVLRGHSTTVEAVAFSPDGSRLATAAFDQPESGEPVTAVRIWEASTGELQHTLPGFGSVAWLPDSSGLVVNGFVPDPAGGGHPALTVLDPATGVQRLAIPLELPATAVAVSPDGEWLAAGLPDGTATVWQVADGELVANVPAREPPDTGINPGELPPAGDLVRVAFGPDRELITLTETGTLLAWGLPAAESPAVLTERGDGVASRLAVTPDGYLLVDASQGTVEVWSLAGTPARHEPLVGFPGQLTDLAVAGDGRLVAAIGLAGPPTLWQRATRTLPQEHPTMDLRFDPRGGQLAVASGGGTAQLWAPEPALLTGSVTHPAEVRRVVYAADGSRASVSLDGTVQVHDPTGAGRGEVRLPDGFTAGTDAAFAPGGGLLAVIGSPPPELAGGLRGAVFLWDADTLQPRGRLPFDFLPLALEFTEDSSQLLVSALGVGEPDPAPDQLRSPDQLKSYLYAYQIDSGEVTERLSFGDERISDLAVSPDGRTAALVGTGRRVQLYDVAQAAVVGEFGEHPASVRRVAFSPDGQLVVTVTASDPVVRLWDAATGTLLAALHGHSGDVNAVAFSPDGQLVASAGEQSVHLWTTDPAVAVRQLCRVVEQAESAEPLPELCD